MDERQLYAVDRHYFETFRESLDPPLAERILADVTRYGPLVQTFASPMTPPMRTLVLCILDGAQVTAIKFEYEIKAAGTLASPSTTHAPSRALAHWQDALRLASDRHEQVGITLWVSQPNARSSTDEDGSFAVVIRKLSAWCAPQHQDVRTLQHHVVRRDVLMSGSLSKSSRTASTIAYPLVEEALRAGVPVLMIGVKGDLPNLMLAFPTFDPAPLVPWTEGSMSPTDPRTPAEAAAELATQRAHALTQWGIGLPRAGS